MFTHSKSKENFTKQGVEKLDALRTLQYAKTAYIQNDKTDDENLKKLLGSRYKDSKPFYEASAEGLQEINENLKQEIKCYYLEN